MNCQEVLSLLYDVIDKEASEIDVKEVQKHLDNCRHCFEVYRLESSMQRFLNERLREVDMTHSLESLKSKVRQRLDEIDRTGPITEKLPFFRRPAVLVAAAASLAVLIGGGFLARNALLHDSIFTPIAQAHRQAQSNPSDFRRDGSTYTTLLRVRSQQQYRLQPAVDKFTLMGGRVESIMGIEVAHFIYCCNEDTISVFVAPSDRFEIPENLRGTEVVRNGLRFYDHRCGPCRLVYHRAGNAVVITASTSDKLDLLKFIPGQAVI